MILPEKVKLLLDKNKKLCLAAKNHYSMWYIFPLKENSTQAVHNLDGFELISSQLMILQKNFEHIELGFNKNTGESLIRQRFGGYSINLQTGDYENNWYLFELAPSNFYVIIENDTEKRV